MTDEHNEERFKIVRALHCAHSFEKMTDVAISFSEEWTGFQRTQILRVVGSLVSSKHISQSNGTVNSEDYTIKLTKKGHAWVIRR